MTKRSTTESRGKAKKLKLKKESIKDLSVKKGVAVKGGVALVSPSMAVKAQTLCSEFTTSCATCPGKVLP